MLGVRLSSASVMTEDIDLAQFRSISIAVEDRIPPVLTTLQSVAPTFEAIGCPFSRQSDAYIAASKLKVEFLTPMCGPIEDAPVELPALGTASQPLRFLDYLIYQECKPVLPYGGGILVNVPDPVRYAWHNLIVARCRVRPEKNLRIWFRPRLCSKCWPRTAPTTFGTCGTNWQRKGGGTGSRQGVSHVVPSKKPRRLPSTHGILPHRRRLAGPRHNPIARREVRVAAPLGEKRRRIHRG